MIFRPRSKGDIALRCDGAGCTERETFARSTEYSAISHWCRRHGWEIRFKGRDRFEHYCPICERLKKLSPRDIERLIA